MEDNIQTQQQNPTTPDKVENPGNKTYTQEEVEKMIQTESDRKVTLALQRKEKELSKKLTEAEKLAKMSEEDRFRYQLEQKEAELQAKEREFLLRDNKMASMKVLAEKGLPVELVDFVVDEDAETMNSKITKLEKYIKDSVSAQVKAKVGGNTPKQGNPADMNQLSVADFRKLSYMEKLEMKRTNPELYNKLSGK
jgi:hypothetical protein